MIGADQILKEYALRKRKSLFVNMRGYRLSWLTMCGRQNEFVEKNAITVSSSIFSIRPAIRKLTEFWREWG